jgi:hypothetical protein
VQVESTVNSLAGSIRSELDGIHLVNMLLPCISSSWDPSSTSDGVHKV